MRTVTVVSILIVLILAGAVFYIVYKYGFESQTIQLTNLSISAKLDGQNTKTGYVIETNKGTILGNTSQSYELQRIERNQVIKIYNKNLPEQKFFKDLKIINLTRDTQRVDLKLEEPKPIEINILQQTPLILELYSEDARDIDFCLKWSLNYIFVKSNFTEMEKPEIYKNWDKCYQSNITLKDSKQEITIEFKEFGVITQKDFINITLIQEEFLGDLDKNIKVK